MKQIKVLWLTIIAVMGFILTTTAQDEIIRRSCRMPIKANSSVPAHQLRAKRTCADGHFIGDRRQLVILVSFSDQEFKSANPFTLWSRILNEENFNEEPFFGSLHDYFLAQSYGQFRLTCDLHYIALTESRVKYRSTDEDDENSKYLVNDLVDVLEEQDIDWSPYDWDGDGYVDQLLIIYAGKGMNDGGGRDSIWPHQYWLSKHEDSQARTVNSGNKEYIIDCYCCVQEITRNGSYGTFGTICHEYSHCLGLPDFYSDNSYVYTWDLMDYGNYNGNGFRPVGYSSYERMYMGWITPTELTTPTSITAAPPLAEEGVAYLIRNDGHSDEYYMLENRQPIGWDATLPGRGLLIFHVDYDEQIWMYGYVNTNTIQRYSIFPANNLTNTYYSAGWGYPYQGNDALTNDTSPASTLLHANSDGSKLMSKPVTDIRMTGDLASFEFMADVSSSINITESGKTQPVETLYRMGRIAIVRYSDGEVKKVVIGY